MKKQGRKQPKKSSPDPRRIAASIKQPPQPVVPSWGKDFLLGLLLLAATLAAYQQIWHTGFIWDDRNFLTQNPILKQADGLYRLWFTASTPDYFPMTSSMLWLEWRLWGNQALGYHIVNVLLHAASAILLWCLLRRLRIPGALLAAAIFAVHPVNVESVAWITEGKNTLTMVFYLASLLWFVTFEDTGKRHWYWLALAAFALALLSKTAVAPLPFVLLLIAWWRRGQAQWKDLRLSIPFFIAAAALGLVTIWFQSHQSIGTEVIRTDGFLARLAGAGWAVWFYLYKALLPVNLIFIYPRWNINPANIASYIPLALLFAAFAVCWRLRRAWGKGLFFGFAYFALMLLPILGFVNIFFMRYSLVADHWQYFAIIGPIALAAAFIRWPAAAVALLVALAALTWRQCRMYADEQTLWETTIAQNPGTWMPRTSLGLIYIKNSQVEKGMAQFKEALRINPNSEEALNNVGMVLAQTGDLPGAIANYRKSLEIKPDYVEALCNLGNALVKDGKLDEAIALFGKALQINPDFLIAHYDLGMALVQKGNTADAITQFRDAIALDPKLIEAHLNLGNLLQFAGQTDAAIAEYQKALAINPDYTDALNKLGDALGKTGKLDDATALFQKALQASPGSVLAHIGLGMVFNQKGKAEDAITQFRQAIALDPNSIDARLNLAALLDNTGRYVAALEQYQAILKIDPNQLQAGYLLGNDLATHGQLDQAIPYFRQALKINPAYSDAYSSLGVVYFGKGMVKEAIDSWQQSLKINPSQPNIQTTLAWVLSTTPDSSLRDGTAAVALAEQANKIIGDANPVILHVLAAAYAETGRYPDALATARRALDLAIAQKNDDLARKLPEEIKSYESANPTREPPP